MGRRFFFFFFFIHYSRAGLTYGEDGSPVRLCTQVIMINSTLKLTLTCPLGEINPMTTKNDCMVQEIGSATRNIN